MFSGAWSKEDVAEASFEPSFGLTFFDIKPDTRVAYVIYNYDTDADIVGKNENGQKRHFCLDAADDCPNYPVYLNGNSSTVKFGTVITSEVTQILYNVTKTGFYALSIVPSLPGTAIKGSWKITFPYGYLPYMLYPLHQV